MGFLFASTAAGYAQSWVLLRARERTILDEAWAFTEIPFYVEGGTIFVCGGMLASFYFMYNVRQQGGT